MSILRKVARGGFTAYTAPRGARPFLYHNAMLYIHVATTQIPL